jgi:hypothetical protein
MIITLLPIVYDNTILIKRIALPLPSFHWRIESTIISLQQANPPKQHCQQPDSSSFSTALRTAGIWLLKIKNKSAISSLSGWRSFLATNRSLKAPITIPQIKPYANSSTFPWLGISFRARSFHTFISRIADFTLDSNSFLSRTARIKMDPYSLRRI